MKKETIINDIKTAGVVVGATLVLNTCGNGRPLSEKQMQTVYHKTDSAVNANQHYRTASKVKFVVDNRISEYRAKNKSLVKKYSASYIKSAIKEEKLYKFMMTAMKYETMALDGDIIVDSEDYIDYGERNSNINYIRRNERWFNDLMMYLSGKYNDRQLLNSEFFKVIKDKNLRHSFEHNTKQIEKLSGISHETDSVQNIIYTKCLNEYKSEEMKKR